LHVLIRKTNWAENVCQALFLKIFYNLFILPLIIYFLLVTRELNSFFQKRNIRCKIFTLKKYHNVFLIFLKCHGVLEILYLMLYLNSIWMFQDFTNNITFKLQQNNKSCLRRNRYITFKYPILTKSELQTLIKKSMWFYSKVFYFDFSKNNLWGILHQIFQDRCQNEKVYACLTSS